MKRLLFALLPLVALLLGLEGLARRQQAAAPARHPGMMVPHPTRIWGLSPGQFTLAGVPVQIDAQGLRAAPEDPAALRVLTLGDSTLFGHGLPDADTPHAQLDAALARRGVDVAARTVGVPGYSTEQTLLLMEELGWALRPDLLVVGSLWSDFQTETFNDRLWMRTLRSPAQRLERLLSHSAAWSWLRLRLEGPEPAQRGGLPVGWVRGPLPQTRSRVPLEDYTGNLHRLADEARARGVGLAGLSLCHRSEVGGRPGPWRTYVRAQLAVAAEVGAPWVDACAVYTASGLSADALFLDELHPSGAANALLAEALAQALLDAGWPQRRLVPEPVKPQVP